MGNKEYVYSVRFKANTSEIKNAVLNLRQTLDTIQSRPIGLDDGSIRAATNSARELQAALQKAVNTDTGKLDISKFSQQLKASGKDLSHYANNLKLLGTDGRKAFMQLTQAIVQAEVPLKKNNKMLEEFATTLKNTARWQLSSSIIQGFTSAISKAIGYAKDLDKSLNDIRIVSGKSAEYMEDFAKKANRAAKNLSASTLEYTNAAKIFYQQGLGGSEVEERTEAVVKMAKVTGESAEQISSYMTAVWNNFDNGTKSLEYYTDAMTALGATTAASTEEIAIGLEKFAAVGDTVGLSYEYATSMVATLVDKTRQSSETVGTALKTILSRIQGLSLGETLEDGTTLNKYSKALASVGVQIKDQFGNLKDMDVILDELGARWNTLAKDQQAALAQMLGGARQYTQIISLMDNYKDFKINVGVAADSEGTLNRQMQIYEESVEAAQKRMKASLEGLYEDLIPEDTIKDFYNLMSSLVDSLGGFIEGMGGIGNVLLPAIGMLANRYMPQLVQGAFNLASNFRQTFSFSKQSEQSIIVQAQELLKKQNIVSKDNENYQKQLSLTQKILELKREQETIGHRLTKEQQARNIEKQKELQLQIDILEAENEQQKAREASMHKMVAGETEDAITSKGTKIEEERQAEIQKANNFYDERKNTATENGASEEVITKINANRETRIQEINTEYDNKYSDMKTEEIARIGKRKKAASELKDSYMGSTLLERSGINNLDGHEDKSYGISLQSSNISGVMADTGNRVEKANQAFSIGSQSGQGIDPAQMDEIVQLQAQFQEQWELASESAKKYEKNEKKILKNKKNEATLEKKIGKDTEARNKLQKQQQKIANKILNYNKKDNKYVERQIKLAKEREDIEKQLSDINKTIDNDTKKLNKSKEQTKALGGDALIQAQQAMSTAEQLGEAEKAALDGKIKAQIENATTEQLLKDQTIAGIQEIATEEGMMFDNRTQAEIAEQEAAEQNAAIMQAKEDRQVAYGQAVAGVTATISGAAMAVQGLQSLGSIWKNEDLSFNEKLASSFMSITSVISGISSAVDGAKSAYNALNTITKKSAEIQAAAAAKKKAAKDKDNASTLKNTLSNIGNAFSDALALGFPACIPVLAGYAAVAAGIVALVGGAIGGIGGMIPGGGNSKEENKEAADKAGEEATAITEEAKQNQSLVKDYKTVLKAYEENGASKEELAEAAMKVAEAYGLESEALQALNGDYDNFNRALDTAIKKENDKVAKANRHAMDTLDAVIYDENGLEKGRGGNWGGGNTYKLEADAEDLDVSGMFSDFNHITVDENGKVTFKAATSGGETTELIAEMSKARDRMEAEYSEAELANNDVYQQLNEKLTNVGNENVEKALQYYESEQGAKLGTEFIDLQNNYEVTDMSSYKKARKAFVKKAKDKGIGEEDALSYFELQDDYSQYHTDYKRLQETDSSVGKDKLEELYNKYGSLVFDAGINLHVDEEQIRQQLELAQQELNNHQLTVEMSAALAGSRTIGEALDKGDMAAVDKIINNSDLKLTDEEKSKILRMSGEEAEEFLKNKAKAVASKRTKIEDDDQSKVKAQEEAKKVEEEARHAHQLAEAAKEAAADEHEDRINNINSAIEGLDEAYKDKNSFWGHVGSYNNEILFNTAKGLKVDNGLTADSDENDIVQAILDKINEENNLNLSQSDLYRKVTTDQGQTYTYFDPSVIKDYVETEFDSSEYDDAIEKAKTAWNEATQKAIDAKEAAKYIITDEQYKQLRQEAGQAQTFEELEIAYTNINKAIGPYWESMERIAEQTPGMVAAVSDYQDKYMANQKKITNAENKLIVARIKGDQAEIEAAEEELRLAKAAAKATEEAFNKYFELVNYKFTTEDKIESLRSDGNVKKSYEDIVNQGVPAYDPNNENLKMDYDIIASIINQSLGTNFTGEDVASNWNSINSILNDTALTAGELTAALVDIELGAIDSGEELQDYFENDLGLSLSLTTEQYDSLATKINNFDFKKGNYEEFLTSITDISAQAATAAGMMEALGDAAPPELTTIYTIYKQSVDMKEDQLSSDNYWNNSLLSGLATYATLKDSSTVEYLKTQGWTVYSDGKGQDYTDGQKAIFLGSSTSLTEDGSKVYTMEIPKGLMDQFQEDLAKRFSNVYQDTVKKTFEFDVDTTVTTSKASTGTYKQLDLKEYSKDLEATNEEIEFLEKNVNKLKEQWEGATYAVQSYNKAINETNVNKKVDALVNDDKFKNTSYKEITDGLFADAKGNYNTETVLGQLMQGNLDLKNQYIAQETIIKSKLFPEAKKQIENDIVLKDDVGNTIDLSTEGLQSLKDANLFVEDETYGYIIDPTKKYDYFNSIDKQINTLTTQQNSYLDGEGNITDQTVYDAVQKRIDALNEFKTRVENGFSDYSTLMESLDTVQKNQQSQNKAMSEIILTTLENTYAEDQKWNELASLAIEANKALYDENNFSATALANREKTRNQDLQLVQDEYNDLKENIAYLEKTPEELRNKEWWNYYLEQLKNLETKSAELFQAEREHVQSYIDDIVGLYEDRNAKIENLQTAYDNILSATEEFTLFDKEGKISDIFERRAKALVGSVSIAQSRLSNAQSEYQDLSKQYAEEVAANKKRLAQGEELVDLTNLETALYEAKGKILSEEAALVEAISAAYEELTTVIEKYNDEIDKQQEKLDAIVEVTEAYISTLETLGERFNIGKVLQPEALQKLQETSLEMAITNVKVAKQQRDAQKGIVEQLDKQLTLVKDNELQYNRLLVIRDEEASKLIETETNLASVMSESISQATELFETNIDRILTTMKDALAGDNFSSLDDLQTAYDRAEETSKRYLDTAKQEYELSKLRRTINSQINTNTTEVANAKLRDILEDINKIEKDNLKMSEYDLKMLNAKYELYKAQIALEEAQNNKSQIRLQRNASGNWSYVFTADQGKIDQAAQKVEDAQYKIYNDSQQYLEQTQKNVLTLQQEWTAALEEIYKDATLSKEERIAKINQTNQYYAGQLSYFGNELSKTLNNTGINFEDTIYGMIADFESFNEAQNEIVNSIAEGIASMEAETDKLASNIKGTMEDAGESFNTFGDKVAELANPNNENGLIKNFNTIADNIGNMCTKISKALEPVLTQLNTLTNVKTNVELPAEKIIEDTKNKYEEDYSSLISDYKNQYDAETESSIRREILYAAQKSNKMRNQKIKDLGLKEKQVTDEDIKNWFQGTAPAPFDTGGYTGDWGSEGKLAVLHEKELILNKEDTKKILSAVEIARMITGNALGQMGNLANAFYVNKYTAKPQELQQNVHIEASFPGVQSAFEIETALKNIVNDVSQYVEIDK